MFNSPSKARFPTDNWPSGSTARQRYFPRALPG
ncbi:hypothetical protein LTSEGIV_0127, partial [Salmonella enterica subsp. enterica serovar Give str. S5-487]